MALIVSIVLLSVFMVLFAYILKNEDICCTNKACKQFTGICNNTTDIAGIKSPKGVTLTIYDTKKDDSVNIGTVIKGSITGSWYFEGEFPVRVLSENMEVLDTLTAKAQSDWMTQSDVPFEVKLDTYIDEEQVVILRFEKSNPSGLDKNADRIDFPIVIKPSPQTTSVKVYFPNKGMGDINDCSLVYPVDRDIPYTKETGRASLSELIEGPTEIEKEKGYFTNINSDVQIQSITIQNGVAKVDFNQKLQDGIGGSCMVTSIRAQIEKTLLQFPTVQTVIISIDGQTQDILQP